MKSEAYYFRVDHYDVLNLDPDFQLARTDSNSTFGILQLLLYYSRNNFTHRNTFVSLLHSYVYAHG